MRHRGAATEIEEIHQYIYAGGKLLRETISDGTTTKTLDFTYDNVGMPYSLIYNNGTATTTYYYINFILPEPASYVSFLLFSICASYCTLSFLKNIDYKNICTFIIMRRMNFDINCNAIAIYLACLANKKAAEKTLPLSYESINRHFAY